MEGALTLKFSNSTNAFLDAFDTVDVVDDNFTLYTFRVKGAASGA